MLDQQGQWKRCWALLACLFFCLLSFLMTQLLALWYNSITILHSISIFTNPSAQAGYDTRSIFKWSLTGLNSEFSFSWTSCLIKAEELSLSYYLPIAGGRIIRFIPFPRVLVLCEMQPASSRIWFRVAVSILYEDKHYTTCTSSFYFDHPSVNDKRKLLFLAYVFTGADDFTVCFLINIGKLI